MANDLGGRIRDRLLRKHLPAPPADRCWAGLADGSHTCAACDAPIRGHDMEFEAQFPGERVIFFHIACHYVWESAASALRIPKRPAC
ncbi:MAG TPA: hypothetical protein VF136_15920 [Methylomirabilota bacterium]|jgi:hypothetical protein